MFVKTLTLFVLRSFLIASVSGCVSILLIDYSQGGKQIVTEDGKEGEVSLPGSGLDVQVLPINLRVSIGFVGPLIPIIPVWGAGVKDPPFQVALYLDPKGQEFLLSPMDIKLLIPGQSNLAPLGFTEPVSLEPHWFKKPGCRLGVDTKTAKRTSGAIRITDKVCIHVLFDIAPPQPGEEFGIFVRGIRKGPLSISGASFIFSDKRSEWAWGSSF